MLKLNVQDKVWKFFRAGGVAQVKIENGEDFAKLDALDKKLWTALSCPVKGVCFDAKTLAMLDADADGKIRADDLAAAAKWLCGLLKNPSNTLRGEGFLKLAEIDEGIPEGRLLAASARQVLKNLGKPHAEQISADDFADPAAVFANTPFNGDGVITALSCGNDAELLETLKNIIAYCGAKPDNSGLDGADEDSVNVFYAACFEAAVWLKAPDEDVNILFLKDKTAAAYAAFIAVEKKIDEYFNGVELVAFDAVAARAIAARTEAFADVFAQSSGQDYMSKLAEMPLAKILGEPYLNLQRGLNPAWAALVKNFVEVAVKPICGELPKISADQWQKIKAAFAPYKKWDCARNSKLLDTVGVSAVLDVVAQNRKAEFQALIERDLSLKGNSGNIAKLEKLLQYNSHLAKLALNFVNFQDFYTQDAAIFQYGTLFLDGRECSLCIKVDDVAKHAAIAPLSYFYLVYCKCSRKAEADIFMVAAMTAGDCDNLIVGRNGLFYDRLGRDWDASIVKIVENPISISQAFWSPYKKVIKWVCEQVAKRAADADKTAFDSITTGVAADPKAVKKIDVGTVAALGVGVGAITAAFGAMLQAFFKLGFLMPLGVIGIILAISLPSMAIAALKLRLRNLGPLLDANGWAVNSFARINILQGGRLTKSAASVAAAALKDKAKAASHKRRGIFLILLVGAAIGASWYFGFLNKVAPCLPQSPYVKAKAECALANKNAQEASPAAQDSQNSAAPEQAAPKPAN